MNCKLKSLQKNQVENIDNFVPVSFCGKVRQANDKTEFLENWDNK